MEIKCELLVNSNVEHLRQIYTGFNLLHRKGFLKLRQTIPDDFTRNKRDANRWVNYKFYNTKAVFDEKVKVLYDAHDWNWIDEEILGEVDFYFKRSYDEEYVSQLKEKQKVFPLGLNYPISSDITDLFQAERSVLYGGLEKVKTVIKGLPVGKYLEVEHLGNMESLPDFKALPKVLFMARAWDTNLIENKSQKEAVEQLNAARAECIRILRKEFKENFFGGLAHEEYAAKSFKDCLLSESELSSKRKYLEILKNFPICVTTTGLNGSNGWKLGEYVAHSKAIVTEPLLYKVPGNFAGGENYLEFSSPTELVNQVSRLFEDANLRHSLMLNNYRYYLSFTRPDALILNTISTVFRIIQKSSE